MKNLKKILFSLLFLAVFAACESEVTIDDPKSEISVEIDTKNDETNEDDERGNG